MAGVSADGVAWAVIDVSPEERAARVASTLEGDAAQYVLVRREG